MYNSLNNENTKNYGYEDEISCTTNECLSDNSSYYINNGTNFFGISSGISYKEIDDDNPF